MWAAPDECQPWFVNLENALIYSQHQHRDRSCFCFRCSWCSLWHGLGKLSKEKHLLRCFDWKDTVKQKKEGRKNSHKSSRSLTKWMTEGKGNFCVVRRGQQRLKRFPYVMPCIHTLWTSDLLMQMVSCKGDTSGLSSVTEEAITFSGQTGWRNSMAVTI